ncbi:MAG: PD40 domain-containing protein [Caldilineaceae bacterium]|nr:PD40 domain-containing protein [Caldilineaceae bacterium]
MSTTRRWLQHLSGLSLLLILLLLGLLLRQQQRPTPPTQQAPSAEDNTVAQLAQPDSPLPTAIVEGTLEPTWTPLPTPLPPSTPTTIPGPTATAWPLSPPAPDAAGSILYPVAKAEIKPGVDARIVLYSISIDKTGQPQGDPIPISGEIQLVGSAAIYPSPDGSRILIEDGWGSYSLLYPARGQMGSPFHDNPNPRGIFFGWHPDSKQILIRAEDNYLDPGLWLVDTDTGQHTTLLALYSTPSSLIGGAVSPDGQKVIYSLKRDFQLPSELWIANTNGTDHRQLYVSDGYILALVWAPDGKQIAFLGDSLTVMNAEGTGVRTFRTNLAIGYNFRPVWSPDNKMLAYVVHEQNRSNTQKTGEDEEPLDPFAATNIHLVNLATGEERPLLNNNSIRNIDPTWSPDGRQIAFVTKQSGTSTIRAVNADGSNLRELSTTGQWIRFPSWTKYQWQSQQ